MSPEKQFLDILAGAYLKHMNKAAVLPPLFTSPGPTGPTGSPGISGLAASPIIMQINDARRNWGHYLAILREYGKNKDAGILYAVLTNEER